MSEVYISFRVRNDATKRAPLPDIHVLHAHDDISCVILEGPVKCHNVFRVAVMHDSKFSHDAFSNFVLCFDMDNLMYVSLSQAIAKPKPR